MGQVAHAGLEMLVERYRLNVFVETGTGHGVSVRDAVAIPALVDIHSIECDNETYWTNYAAMRPLFPRVQLWHGRSETVLQRIAYDLGGDARVLWYLDAHFPGSGRAQPVPMLPLTGPAEDLVPVAKEVESIRRWRNIDQDVIVIDDRCLWEADEYDVGDLGIDFRDALQRNDIALLEELLQRSHECVRTRVDAGYALFLPRTT